MSDAKRPDPKRRSPTSRPAAAGRSGAPGRGARKPVAKPAAAAARKDTTKPASKPNEEKAKPEVIEPVRQSIAEAAELQSEQRMGFTARRAAVLAVVVCVLTLTIAGPVRTYFAQRTEMRQLTASEAALRAEIAELEEQKVKLADPAFIAAQARERLGFVMPGEIPYQVQLPPGAVVAEEAEDAPTALVNNDPWYTSLWKTIADEPHGAPPPPPAPPVEPGQVPPPPEPEPVLPPEPGQPGG